MKALSLLLNTSLFPRGFQIRSRTITVTFAHEHSFHPIYTPSDWSFKGAGGQELAYWDDKAYAALYISPIAEPHPSSPNGKSKIASPISNRTEPIGNGHHADAEINELLSSIDAPEPQLEPTTKNNGTSSSQDETHSSSKHSIKSQSSVVQESDPAASRLGSESKPTATHRKTEDQKAVNKLQADDKNLGEGGTDQVESNHSNQKGTEVIKPIEKKKNSVEPIATKKMVANIQKWQSKHQEIASAGTTDDKNLPNPIPESTIANDEDDFSDFNRLTCILCQRQFKSAEDLQRHNSLSNLHKTNFQNDKLKRAARLKKAASLAKKSNSSNLQLTSNSVATNQAEGGNGHPTTTVTAAATPKYTDRAAARREAYGQPDAPDADKHEAKKARYEPAPQPILAPAQPDKDGIQATNVGSKMLEKMGWQKGEGLGAGTNGRVDPIVAAQYSKGVGLGASTAVNVGHYEDSKKGFLDQVKDKTVQRFHQD